MRRNREIAGALVGAVAIALMVGSRVTADEAVRADGARTIESMRWLAGNWAGDMWGGRFAAYYTTPEGGKIISHSKLLRNNKTAFYEFELFEVREGKVQLSPFPRGKAAVGLTLTSCDAQARKAVFENPKKDYPTRIVYHREADDRLVITLTDPHGGSDKVERFALQRQ